MTVRNDGGGFFSNRKQAEQKPDDRVIKAIEPRRKPTVNSIPLGIEQDGRILYMPLFEKHALVCGSSGSGKSFAANRILLNVMRIPMEQRIVVGIDLKGGTEIGKWRPCLAADASTIEYANLVLNAVEQEMNRRTGIISRNPRKYKDSKLVPCKEFPLIVVYIDEMAALCTKMPDKEQEAIRQEAFSHLNQLLYLGRAEGIVVIACIQRPDSKMLSGFMKNNFTTRICGRVGTYTDSTVMFGESNVDASKLSHHWFIAHIDGRYGYPMFKVPGKPGDEDLWEVINDKSTHVDRDKFKWLYNPYSRGAVPDDDDGTDDDGDVEQNDDASDGPTISMDEVRAACDKDDEDAADDVDGIRGISMDEVRAACDSDDDEVIDDTAVEFDGEPSQKPVRETHEPSRRGSTCYKIYDSVLVVDPKSDVHVPAKPGNTRAHDAADGRSSASVSGRYVGHASNRHDSADPTDGLTFEPIGSGFVNMDDSLFATIPASGAVERDASLDALKLMDDDFNSTADGDDEVSKTVRSIVETPRPAAAAPTTRRTDTSSVATPRQRAQQGHANGESPRSAISRQQQRVAASASASSRKPKAPLGSQKTKRGKASSGKTARIEDLLDQM